MIVDREHDFSQIIFYKSACSTVDLKHADHTQPINLMCENICGSSLNRIFDSIVFVEFNLLFNRFFLELLHQYLS